jgi:hypothetical protein
LLVAVAEVVQALLEQEVLVAEVLVKHFLMELGNLALMPLVVVEEEEINHTQLVLEAMVVQES